MWLTRGKDSVDCNKHVFRHVGIILLIVCTLVWAGYGFSAAHLAEGMGLSVSSLPSFQHFPGPVRGLARRIVSADPLVPAPAFIKGVATAWSLNHTAPPSYLLGKIKNGGWWYFFLVSVGVKTPLAFLVLVFSGLF